MYKCHILCQSYGGSAALITVAMQAQYDIMDSYHSLPKRSSMSRKLLQPESDDEEEKEEDEEGTVSCLTAQGPGWGCPLHEGAHVMNFWAWVCGGSQRGTRLVGGLCLGCGGL